MCKPEASLNVRQCISASHCHSKEGALLGSVRAEQAKDPNAGKGPLAWTCGLAVSHLGHCIANSEVYAHADHNLSEKHGGNEQDLDASPVQPASLSSEVLPHRPRLLLCGFVFVSLLQRSRKGVLSNLGLGRWHIKLAGNPRHSEHFSRLHRCHTLQRSNQQSATFLHIHFLPKPDFYFSVRITQRHQNL